MSGIKSLLAASAMAVLLHADDACVRTVQTVAFTVTGCSQVGRLTIAAIPGATPPGGGNRSPRGSSSIIPNGGATSTTITMWHPAWWWWNSQPGWVREHHPEWWGDYYQGTVVPGDVVVSVSAGLGARASSGMVGRCRRRRLVSRGMVVATAAATGCCRITRNGGAITGTDLWYPAPWWWQLQPRLGNRASSGLVGRLLRRRLVRGAVVVPVSSRLGSRASPGLVGRLRRPSLLAPGGWWWQVSAPTGAAQYHPDWWGDFDDQHFWRPRRMVVAERAQLGARESSRLVGRLRRQQDLAARQLVVCDEA